MLLTSVAVFAVVVTDVGEVATPELEEPAFVDARLDAADVGVGAPDVFGTGSAWDVGETVTLGIEVVAFSGVPLPFVEHARSNATQLETMRAGEPSRVLRRGRRGATSRGALERMRNITCIVPQVYHRGNCSGRNTGKLSMSRVLVVGAAHVSASGDFACCFLKSGLPGTAAGRAKVAIEKANSSHQEVQQEQRKRGKHGTGPQLLFVPNRLSRGFVHLCPGC